MRLQTARLFLREMVPEDLPALSKMLQDPEVMYAYAHTFSNVEVQDWLDRQRRRYSQDGFGLWAAIERQSGKMIGQCGLTMQDCGMRRVLEIGYLFQKAYWHRGFAIEAARACKQYAFEKLQAQEVFSIIRENNFPSQRVALRNGMELRGSINKHYYGLDMPHLVFSIMRDAWAADVQPLVE